MLSIETTLITETSDKALNLFHFHLKTYFEEEWQRTFTNTTFLKLKFFRIVRDSIQVEQRIKCFHVVFTY